MRVRTHAVPLERKPIRSQIPVLDDISGSTRLVRHLSGDTMIGKTVGVIENIRDPRFRNECREISPPVPEAAAIVRGSRAPPVQLIRDTQVYLVNRVAARFEGTAELAPYP
jgi:hypothetical protein